jgi:hypothetical protein
MGYLKTVVTYHQPSEAEVDKAFLESHGISVCLLNANTSRNELGAPFYVQLQVVDEEYERAVQILSEANPQRFGSIERVADIDRMIKQGFLRFFVVAVPVALLMFWWAPLPRMHSEPQLFGARKVRVADWRLEIAILAGLAAGTCAMMFWPKQSVSTRG